ncbi:hypothetical protein CAPTEDRAFT_220778 [Capitella teleta]|uniref:SAM domain-containing protein n=1 Tax=Capitella teleta TaxID=283909 RepID=R7U8M9_CAPTE|nr:hypothetical protein CAPTEDRAFT_220778 [Capitella teleta]|eukprot:ELU02466.1 hypothetical protein CAPTEDRAFT_220778 [Capitella teleta]
MDWAVDARLPQRYKEWRREVRNELRLSMAEDSDKTKLWACTYVVVCSGEQGEDILQQAGMLGETNDHKKIFKAFDNFVTPSSHYIEDCIDYFYMKQGDLSISEFQSKAEKLIERIIPSYKASSTITHADVKQLLLRNLLLVGLSHRDMLRECQRLKNSDCTSAKILELARQAEYRETTESRIATTIRANPTPNSLTDLSASEMPIHQNNNSQNNGFTGFGTPDARNTSSTFKSSTPFRSNGSQPVVDSTPLVRETVNDSTSQKQQSTVNVIVDDLRTAAMRGQAASARSLIQDDLYTALFAACSSKCRNEDSLVRCLDLLVAKGADFNGYDKYEMSAVMYAARGGHAEVTKRLVELKADLEKQDSRGMTALMLAAQRGHVMVVKALLDGEADLTKHSIDGSKAIDHAFVAGHAKIEEMLKSYGSVDPNSSTPLLLNGSTEAIEEAKAEAAEAASKSSSFPALTAPSAAEISSDLAQHYGDLEVFLTAVGLPQLIEVCHKHQVELRHLLRMTDEDLQINLGLHQSGVRKKLLDEIRAAHIQEWQTSSLPQLIYNRPLTCAECVAIVANVKKHTAYVASTIGYMSDQINVNLDILRKSEEDATAEELFAQTEDAMQNVVSVHEELQLLSIRLASFMKKENFLPPDLILRARKPRRWLTMRRKVLLTSSAILLGGFAVWHQGTVLAHCQQVWTKLMVQLSKYSN